VSYRSSPSNFFLPIIVQYFFATLFDEQGSDLTPSISFVFHLTFFTVLYESGSLLDTPPRERCPPILRLPVSLKRRTQDEYPTSLSP